MPDYASLVRAAGRHGPWPAELSQAIAALPAEPPLQESLRAWLLRHVDAKTAEAIIGVVFIPTFDHDPGRLSAAFARERLRRALAGGARHVAGGWSTLVSLLAERAASLGAQIRTQTRVATLPAGPAILATSLATARQLTGDRSLTWPSARVATVDLGLRTDASPGWFRVMDLDNRIYAARYSLADPSLAPPGHELIQISAACAPDERKPTPKTACSACSANPAQLALRGAVAQKFPAHALHRGHRPARENMARPPRRQPRHRPHRSHGPVRRARTARRDRNRRRATRHLPPDRNRRGQAGSEADRFRPRPVLATHIGPICAAQQINTVAWLGAQIGGSRT